MIWTRRRLRVAAALVFLSTVLATATQPATAGQLTPGRSPVSLGAQILSSLVRHARDLVDPVSASLPSQRRGSGSGAHNTRAQVGTGHAPGVGLGQSPLDVAHGPRVTGGESASAGKGFDPKTSTRLTAKSNAYASWWQNADGSQTEQVSDSVVNYRDSSGAWQPIDTALVRGSDDRWTVRAAGYGLSLAPGSGASESRGAAFRFGAHSAAARASGPLATLTAGSGQSVSWSLAGAAPVTGTESGDAVTYPSILPDTDLVLAAGPSGVKESLVLTSAEAAHSWTFPLTLTGLSLVDVPGGVWRLRDDSGDVAATLGTPFALASGKAAAAQTSEVSYALTTVDGAEQLTMTLSAAWLDDPARVFPVTVDPTITVSTAGSGLSTYVSAANPTKTNAAAGVLDVGYSGTDADFAYIGFPAAAVSQDLQHTGFHVTSAQFAAFQVSGSTSGSEPFDVYSVGESWNPATFDYADDTFSLYQNLGKYAGSDSSAASCAVPGEPSTGNWLYTPLSASDMEAFALGGLQWNGVMLASDSTTDTGEYRVFASASNGSCSPYLSLTYTPDVAPTVSASTMSPANGQVVQTLTPQLAASGTDPDAWPNPSVSYEFQVFDSSGGTAIAKSSLLSTGSWTVPKDTLKWGESYQWTVCVWDGYECAAETFDSFQTNTPGPALTQNLSQSSSGHGFDVATGDYTTSAQDADIAGVGPQLSVQRDYNSLDTRNTDAFGQGWSSMVDAGATQELDAAGNLLAVAVREPDGAVAVFGYNPGDGSYSAPDGQFATLLPITSSGTVVGYTLTDKSGTTYTFGHESTAPLARSGSAVYTTAGVFGISQVADAAKHTDTFVWGVTNGVAGTHVLSESSTVTGRTLYFTWSTPSGAAYPHVSAVTTSYATSANAATAQYWGYAYSGDRLSRVYAPGPNAPAAAPGSSSPYTGYTYRSGSDYQQAVLDTSPYQYWPMDDATGNASSLSLVGQNIGAGRAYFTNLTGDTVYPVGPMANIGSGATGAVFDGTNSVMTLPPGMVLNDTYISAGLWFKATKPGPLLCEQNSSIESTPTQQACPLYIGTDGKLHAGWYIGTTTSIVSPGVVDDGAWHYALLSGQGNTQTLFLDGAAAGTLSGTIDDLAMTDAFVGAGYNLGNWPDTPGTKGDWYFTGSISDVAVYKSAVPATVAASLYQVATTSAAWLTQITRPRAVSQNTGEAPADTVAYDAVDGRVGLVTDANGATWTLGNPGVVGSSQVFREAVLGDQPAFYYRLGDAAGSSYAADEVNPDAWANADLTATYNAVTLGTTPDVFGDGYAATFDGSATAPSFVQPPSGLMSSAPVSIALWFDAASGASGPLWSEQNADFTKGPSTATNMLYVGTNGHLYGSFSMGTTSAIASKDRVDNSTWHYAVLAANATSESLYLDGTLVGTQTGTYHYSGQNEDVIGAGYSPGAGQNEGAKGTWDFAGSISDAAFFHAQLSQDQVTQMWLGYHSTVGSLVPLEQVTVTDPADSADGADGAAHTEVYEYDPAHGLRPVKYTDGTGAATTYSYDTHGFEDVVTDANGDETITGHDVRGNAVSTTTCQYQATNKCSTSYKTYYPDDSTASFTASTLDPRDDQMLTASDGRSSSASDTTYRAAYTYNASADLLTETNPAGHGVTNVYTTAASQAACDPAASTAGPVLSSTQYAPTDLLYTSTTSGGAVTTYSYYPDGDVCTVLNPDHLQTFFTYDGLGRVLTKTVSGGDSILPNMVGFAGTLKTSYVYDGDGRLVQTTAPAVTDRVTGAVHTAVTANVYDADGDLTSTTVSDSTGGDYSRSTSYTYDDYDRRQTATTPDGNASTNDSGTTIAGSSGHTTAYAYDLWGNVKTQTDELTGTATRTVVTLYNADDQPIATQDENTAADGTYAAGQTLTTDTEHYDAGGRLSSETDAMGDTTCYYYYDNGLTYQEVRTSAACPGSALTSGAGDVTDTQVVSTTYYDADGNAVKAFTNNGVTETDTVYNPDGTVASTKLDPSGVDRITGYSYTPDGFVAETVSSADADGVVAVVSDVQQTFDPLGDVMTRTVADGSQSSETRYTLDQRGLAAQVEDPDGNVTLENYDEDGRLVESTSPSIPVTLWCQTATSYPLCTTAGTAVTTTAVGITTIGYDTFGNQVETESPDSPDAASASSAADKDATVATYDADGNKTSVTLPSYTAPGASAPTTATTDYRYDADGEVVSESDPVAAASNGAKGEQTTYTYTMLGTVASRTNTDLATGAAAVTSYTYYANGSQHTTTSPISAGRSLSTGTVDDFMGRTLTSSTAESEPSYGTANPTTYTTTDTYGRGGWLSTTQSPDGDAVTYAYDNAGEQTSATDILGDVTRTGYDGAGRANITTLPDGSSAQTVYDEAGNQSSVATYASGGAQLSGTGFSYDGDGRLTRSTAQEPNQSTYNSADTVDTTYDYDATGQLTEEVAPLTGSSTVPVHYGYDAAGNQTSYTDGNGDTTYQTYNAWNLPEQKVVPATATDTTLASRTTTGTYDADGRPTLVSEPVATSTVTPITVSSAYDGFGDVLSEDGAGAEGADTTRSFTYDLSGMPTGASAQSATGSTLTSESFSYDDRGDLLSATGSAGASSFTYDGDGLMRSRTDASGTTAYDYNDDDQLSSLTDAATGTTLGYSYNDLGQVQQISYGGADTRTFDYDAAHEVSSDTLATASRTAISALAYTWDTDGDLLSKTDSAGTANTYGYDASGRLTTWSDGTTQTTYSYDADSNRTGATATTIATGAVTSDQTFTYDARDELTGTTDSVTTASSSYSYTPRSTTSQVASVSATGATGTTAYQDDAFGQQTGAGAAGYTYDALGRLTNESGSGKNTTLQYSGTGNDVADDGTDTYSRNPGGGLVATADPTAKTSDLIWTDLHTDVVGEFAANGTALNGTETYSPLGAVIADTGATAGLSLGYQSEFTDAGTGHVNMAARWYNPATGQFTSTDTAANSAVPDTANANPFAYADDNPLTGTDPTGHWLKFSDDDAASLVDAAQLRAMSSASYGSAAYWTRFHNNIEYDVKTYIPLLRAEEGQFDHYYTPIPLRWVDPDCVDAGGHNACSDGPEPGLMARASLAQYAASDAYGEAMDQFGKDQINDQLVSLGVGGVAGLVCSALAGPIAGGACAGAANGLTQKGLECAQGYDTNCSLGAFLKTAVGSAATGAVMSLVTMAGSYVVGKMLDDLGSFLESDMPSDLVVDEGTADAVAEGGLADYLTANVSTVDDTFNSTIDDLDGALADGPPAEVPAPAASKPSSSTSTGNDANTAPPAETVQTKLVTDATGPVAPEEAPPALEAAPPKVNAPPTAPGSDAAETESTAASTSSSTGCTTHSFVGSTPVVMSDGSTKPVDQVKVGDTVENSAPGKSGTQAHRVDAVIVTTTDHDFVNVTIKPAAPTTKTTKTTKTKLARAASTLATLATVAILATITPTSSAALASTTAPPAAALGSAAAAGTEPSAPADAPGPTLTTTYHHPFYDVTQGAFVQAQYLKPGDYLQTPTGPAQIAAVSLFHSTATTYDLTIGNLHTYYVVAGSTPVLVHNCTPVDVATSSGVVQTNVSGSNDLQAYADFLRPNYKKGFGPVYAAKFTSASGRSYFGYSGHDLVPDEGGAVATLVDDFPAYNEDGSARYHIGCAETMCMILAERAEGAAGIDGGSMEVVKVRGLNSTGPNGAHGNPADPCVTVCQSRLDSQGISY